MAACQHARRSAARAGRRCLKPQRLGLEMARLRVHRMRYEELLNKQPQLRQIRQANGQLLTAEQNQILDAQLHFSASCSTRCYRGGDTLITELTKLKVSSSNWRMRLKRVNEATTVICSGPLTLARYRSRPVDLVQRFTSAYLVDTFNQLGKASIMMLTSKETLLRYSARWRWSGLASIHANTSTGFAERSASRVRGKSPGITSADAAVVFWSILGRLAAAVLWATLSAMWSTGSFGRIRWPSPSAMA